MAFILSGQYYGRGGQTGELQVFGERPEAHSTFTCAHCSRIVVVKHKASPDALGGCCKVCDKLICPTCAGKMGCTPWEKQMEAMEAKDRFHRALSAL